VGRVTLALRSGLAEALGPGATAEDVESAGADLLRRWSEPHRHYHTTAHLIATLEAVAALLDGTGPAVPDRGAVELAAWFHDAVHTGRAGSDEEASAALAEQVLTGLGQPAERVAEVARLVRLTARHDPADGDVAGQVLCDADLSVLAATPDRYAAYTAAVRREYAHVPDGAFRSGRAAVLRGLLAGPLFRTEPGRRAWLAGATANVTAELGRLETPPA
jgi:predicted metal-dependent HD superfamily phosphohydrolase